MAHTTLISQLLNPKSRSLFILSLVVLVLPTGYDVFINPLLLVVLINTLISVRSKDWARALKSPVFFLPALFYGYYALTAFWASNQVEAGPQLETKMSLLLAPLVIAANAHFLDATVRKRMLSLFVMGNVLTLLYAFGYAITKAAESGSMYFISESGSKVSYFTYTTLADPIMHVGYLSTYVGIALFICLYMLWQNETTKPLWWSATIFLFLSMVLMQGRMNILAFFAVLGIVVLYFAVSKKAYKWFAYSLIPIGLFALLVAFGPDSLKSRFLQLPDFSYDITAPASEFNSATYRLAEWAGASKVIVENPIFGTGVGDNRIALQQAYSDLGFQVGLERHYNAHNQYLETTLASGFVGLFLLLLLLAGYIRIALTNKDYAMAVSMLFFAMCMLTESMLERAWAVVLLSVFIPIILLAQPEPQTEEHRKN